MPSEPGRPAGAAAAGSARGRPAVQERPGHVEATEVFWVCVFCRARNPAAVDACAHCGRPFGAGLATPTASGRGRRWVYVWREVVILNALFVVWRVVAHEALTGRAGAHARGLALWRAERRAHLPSEGALQRLLSPDLLRAADAWYAWLFAPVLALTLLWLLLRHRDTYGRVRTTVVAFTGLALLLQLIPVAPPRLIPGLGVLDSARRDGLSVYPVHGLADQLSAMPSVHVGWALIVALAVIGTARSPWRWAVLAYPLLTMLVVLVTGNHYWLDGLASAALLGVVLEAQRLLRPRRAVPQVEPTLALVPV